MFSFCLKFTCLKFWFTKFVTLKLCLCCSHSECSNTKCWDHYWFWFRSSCYEGCCKDFEYVWCAFWSWLLMNYRVYFGIQELLIIKFYFLVYFNSTITNYNMRVKIVSAHRTPEMMFSCLICPGERHSDYRCWCWRCSPLARQVYLNYAPYIVSQLL